MKKQFFSASMVFAMLFLSGACDKEERQVTDSPISPPETEILERLRTFRGQIKAVSEGTLQRGSETITLEEALWDIENEFNVAHTRSGDYYSETAEHNFSLFLSIEEDHSVQIDDVVTLYALVEEQARQAYASDGFENKGFISLKIESGMIDGDRIRLDFTGRTGNRTNYNPPTIYVDGPFNDDDNWVYAAPVGKCDDPDIPSGADEQLQEKLYDVLIPDPEQVAPGFRNIYVNRKHFIFDGADYQGLFYCDTDDCNCIPFYMMNSYYQSLKRILGQLIPEQYHLNGYHLDAFEIRGIQNAVEHYITHQVYAEYGQRIQISISEFGEVQDLLD